MSTSSGHIRNHKNLEIRLSSNGYDQIQNIYGYNL